MRDAAPHEHFMRMALGLAARGAGRVAPNPMVGAVLVRDGQVLAKGWHRAAGMDHAEVEALAAVDFKADGCDLYVNLEPCCHHGRTPPCTDSVAESEVRRVFVAMIDPNPVVSGNGVKELRKRGVEVVTGLLEEQAQRLNASFSKWVRTARPLVTLKMAATLDGKTAQRDSSARWITSREARRYVHRLRSHSDCVLVGAGTALHDDPLLLPTLAGKARRPLRVVIDETAGVGFDSQLARTARDSDVVLYAAEGAEPERIAGLEERGVHVVGIRDAGGLLHLPSILDDLGRREVQSVLVEGGARLASSLIAEGLVDRFILFFAPKLLADPLARPLVDDLGVRDLDGARRFHVIRTRRFGPDVMIEMEPGDG